MQDHPYNGKKKGDEQRLTSAERAGIYRGYLISPPPPVISYFHSLKAPMASPVFLLLSLSHLSANLLLSLAHLQFLLLPYSCPDRHFLGKIWLHCAALASRLGSAA